MWLSCLCFSWKSCGSVELSVEFIDYIAVKYLLPRRGNLNLGKISNFLLLNGTSCFMFSGNLKSEQKQLSFSCSSLFRTACNKYSRHDLLLKDYETFLASTLTTHNDVIKFCNNDFRGDEKKQIFRLRRVPWRRMEKNILLASEGKTKEKMSWEKYHLLISSDIGAEHNCAIIIRREQIIISIPKFIAQHPSRVSSIST